MGLPTNYNTGANLQAIATANQPIKQRQTEQALAMLTGGLPSYMAFTPENVAPFLDAGLAILQSNQDWDGIQDFERNIVQKALDSNSYALRALALDYMLNAAKARGVSELPISTDEFTKKVGAMASSMNPAMVNIYGSLLGTLAGLAPSDVGVQNLINSFYSGGSPISRPQEQKTRFMPAYTLLEQLGPQSYAATGLPLPQAPVPNALTDLTTRQMYEDMAGLVAQYGPEGSMYADPTGARPGLLRLPSEYVKTIEERIRDIISSGTKLPSGTTPELKALKAALDSNPGTSYVGPTKDKVSPPTLTALEIFAAEAVKNLARDPNMTPRKAKDYFMRRNGQPAGKADPDRVREFGGGEEGEAKVRAIIAEIDRNLNAGYSNMWAPWVK